MARLDHVRGGWYCASCDRRVIEVEQVVLADGLQLEAWPTLLAVRIATTDEEIDPRVRLLLLCELYETVLRLLTGVAAAAVHHLGPMPDAVARRCLACNVEKPTVGQWRHLADALLAALPPCGLREDVAADVGALESVKGLIELRNNLAHGSINVEGAPALAAEWARKLRSVLLRLQVPLKVGFYVLDQAGGAWGWRGTSPPILGQLAEHPEVQVDVSLPEGTARVSVTPMLAWLRPLDDDSSRPAVFRMSRDNGIDYLLIRRFSRVERVRDRQLADRYRAWFAVDEASRLAAELAPFSTARAPHLFGRAEDVAALVNHVWERRLPVRVQGAVGCHRIGGRCLQKSTSGS